jgi:hypothetical protein
MGSPPLREGTRAPRGLWTPRGRHDRAADHPTTGQAEAAGFAAAAVDDPDDAPAATGALDDDSEDVLDDEVDDSEDVAAGIEELFFEPDPDRASFR